MRYLTDKDVYAVLTEVYHHRTDIQHKALKEAIDRVPTADVVERRRGKWIWMGDKGDSRFMCSICKWKEAVPTRMGVPNIWEYCPSCGAYMREDEDERAMG